MISYKICDNILIFLFGYLVLILCHISANNEIILPTVNYSSFMGRLIDFEIIEKRVE